MNRTEAEAATAGPDAGRRKVALITGITGQDGSYLCEFLLNKGYEVHGVMRRSSVFTTQRIEHLYQDRHQSGVRLRLHYGDLLDAIGLRRILTATRATEVYNLGAQSHVRTSFDQPIYTAEAVAMGTLNLLEALRDYRDSSGDDVRFYQASSSEMYGKVCEVPQNERTPFYPRSPYACAKVHAYWQVVNYREAYGLFACNGILFNHESPRRGETFVTRKITRAATRIKLGMQDCLYLGNLDAKRDWGFAGDYVVPMWLMLQQADPDDYVIATGETHSVRELLDVAFGTLDLDWKRYVRIDKTYLRPTEVDILLGDATRAHDILGWRPTVSFIDLVRMMIDADMELARREKTLVDAGYGTLPGWHTAESIYERDAALSQLAAPEFDEVPVALGQHRS
ncbi:MAG: GDP-mannose 4,6-dehydratase [Phycisphaerales bacterium]|nr:MAG: GDP-mannose 4,6-dehydratase [Phycisphaerales bacterium]